MSAVRRFPVVLRPGEDGWLVVECPVLEGCISQGRTRQEALANIAEAIGVCFEADGAAQFELDAVDVHV